MYPLMPPSVDRALLIRHFAICLAAVLAYLLRSELRIGYTAIWIVGISASLNFLTFAFRTHPGVSRWCGLASPVIGVGSWGALMAVTNGATSPFVAGLWLEVVLSAMSHAGRGVVIVTAGALSALWIQQAWQGLEGSLSILALQSGFLAGMGAVIFVVTNRSLRAQRALSRRHAEVSERLLALEVRLEDERVLSRTGEKAALLAHGLKNVVHSVRGFADLLEPKLEGTDRSAAALAGVRASINDLEELARLTLDAGSDIEVGAGPVPPCECDPVGSIERAVQRLSAAHAGVRWSISCDTAGARLHIPAVALQEILMVLMLNAAEAMHGFGEGAITAQRKGSMFSVLVRDLGAGISASEIEGIFRPGYTTKPEGSGYGLFLARRLAAEHGGRLSAASAGGRGTVFELSLPLANAGVRMEQP